MKTSQLDLKLANKGIIWTKSALPVRGQPSLLPFLLPPASSSCSLTASTFWMSISKWLLSGWQQQLSTPFQGTKGPREKILTRKSAQQFYSLFHTSKKWALPEAALLIFLDFAVLSVIKTLHTPLHTLTNKCITRNVAKALRFCRLAPNYGIMTRNHHCRASSHHQASMGTWICSPLLH